MSIIVVFLFHFHVFWLLFMIFICLPSTSGLGDKGVTRMLRLSYTAPADDPKQVFINEPVKGYDTDFIPFMKKMFSELPGVTKIKEAKKGPNVGYRPYWYAYNFGRGEKPRQEDLSPHQSSHEEWDYGLGRGSGRGLWGAGELSLVRGAGDAVLGAGDIVEKDFSGGDATSTGPKKVCYPNMGKTCELGPPPEDYNAELIEGMRKRTIACDTCTDKNKRVGLVCAVDKTGTVFQEMDLCVMNKMNCLGGTAYVESWTHSYFSTYPFLMQPQWGRVSVRGEYDCNIRMYDKYAYGSGKTSYWFILYGWPQTGPYSALYRDYSGSYDWGRWWKNAINTNKYTEYTITWNPQNGWFLMSQARTNNWQEHFYVEYVDPKPRDMTYIDVSAGWSQKKMEFILHDLTMLYTGACEYQAPVNDSFPSDTDAARSHVRDAEAAYERRDLALQQKGVRPQDWDAEDGSYIEY